MSQSSRAEVSLAAQCHVFWLVLGLGLRDVRAAILALVLGPLTVLFVAFLCMFLARPTRADVVVVGVDRDRILVLSAGDLGLRLDREFFRSYSMVDPEAWDKWPRMAYAQCLLDELRNPAKRLMLGDPGSSDLTEYQVLAGWPCYAFVCTRTHRPNMRGGILWSQRTVDVVWDGIGKEPQPQTVTMPAGFLPLRPLVPGFIIDTALYSVVIWIALVFVGFSYRYCAGLHRLHRNCCPLCLYPLMDDTHKLTCSECGFQVAGGTVRVEDIR